MKCIPLTSIFVPIVAYKEKYPHRMWLLSLSVSQFIIANTLKKESLSKIKSLLMSLIKRLEMKI